MKNILLVCLAICCSIVSNAQTSLYDSLSFEQKIFQMQFEMDLLKKSTARKSDLLFEQNQLALDSLNQRIAKAEKEMKVVRYSLYKTHKQFQVSNKILIVGVNMSFLGTIFLATAESGSPGFQELSGVVLSLGGFVLAGIIAPIFRIDSFKYLSFTGKNYYANPDKKYTE